MCILMNHSVIVLIELEAGIGNMTNRVTEPKY